MDANAIFRKTHKGLEEIERRIYRLSPRERLLLIQVDGKRSLGALAGKPGLDRDGLETANKLLHAGFIELVPEPGIAAQLAAPPPTRQSLLPSNGHPPPPGSGGGAASRPIITPPPQQSPSPPSGAPLPRPPTHAAALGNSASAAPRAAIPQTPAAPLPAQKPVPDPRSERRPANWLSSTVAHLTNMFSGGDMDPEPPRREVRSPIQPPKPGAPPAPATERKHPAHLAATMAHGPVIDLTAEADPRFAARPATGEARPLPAQTREAAPRQGYQGVGDKSSLASAASHEAVLDLTDPSDLLWGDDVPAELLPPEIAPMSPTQNRAPPAPASGLPARRRVSDSSGPGTQRVAPLAQQQAVLPDPNNCGQRDTCPGCSRCPGNSVSLARNFMKESLIRFSGKTESTLTLVLDQCRSLAELQRQFEPWLRDLLLTTEGITEAPSLAAKLQRMLLQ